MDADISGMGTQRPMRILHVLNKMERYGVATWLMHVLRSIDRTKFKMDFLVEYQGHGAYDDEARTLGSRVFVGGDAYEPVQFVQSFRHTLRAHGPYDVIHLHERIYSYVMPFVRRAGTAECIAHSHNAVVDKGGGIDPAAQVYRIAMRYCIKRYATAGLACSAQAAADLFGPRWREDARFRLLYCGIDLAPFRAPVDRDTVRASLGIPQDAFVVGHVGRFAAQKNHRLLVEVAGALAAREPELRVLLAGDGELLGEVRAQVEAAGLGDRVIFAGSRGDVPELLRAMDVFLFPSRYEGLGLALVEAQAAGLPCVIADVIPPEADVVPGLVRRVGLGAPVAAWAEAVCAGRGMALAPGASLRAVEASPFNIETSVRLLEMQYACA